MNRSVTAVCTIATLALTSAGCGDAPPTAPVEGLEEALAPTAELAATLAAEGDEHFLFGHHNSRHFTLAIDTATGATADIGPIGFSSTFSAMATSRAPVPGPGGVTYPAGTHFGLMRDTGDGNSEWIIAVNTEDGSGEKLVRVGSPVAGRGIAFGPDGATLYLIETTFGGPLSIIDTETGVVTPVGNSGRPSSSLSFDPDTGKFFVISGGYLWRVDPSLATTPERVWYLGLNACTVARAPDGTVFTINTGTGRLVRLDLATRTRKGVGSGLGQICGTAFAEVKAVNQPPQAVVGLPPEALEGFPVAFDGSGSSDPEGEALTYAWDFGDGATSSLENPSHTYADDGVYAVKLTVSDPAGTSHTAAAELTVHNVAPTVDAGPDAEIDLGDPFVLAAGFADPGAADSWEWSVSWGDGSPAAAGATADQGGTIAPSHVFTDAGEYTVTVTVTDDDGGTGSDALTVTVVGYTEVEVETSGSVNLKKRGVLPVTVFGGEDLDVSSVEPAAVTLGDEDGADTPVASRRNGTFMAAVEDVDGDGWPDLVLHFDVQAMVDNGDLHRETTELVLLGEAGGHRIRGVVPVRVVGR